MEEKHTDIKTRWKEGQKNMQGAHAGEADEAILLARAHRAKLLANARKGLRKHREATEDDSGA